LAVPHTRDRHAQQLVRVGHQILDRDWVQRGEKGLLRTAEHRPQPAAAHQRTRRIVAAPHHLTRALEFAYQPPD
jgi:hypothetical protein